MLHAPVRENPGTRVDIGHWKLVIHWSLSIGHWSFPMSHPEKTLIQFLLTMLAVIAIAIFNWIKNRRTDEPPQTGSERKITPPTSVPRQRMPPAPRPAA